MAKGGKLVISGASATGSSLYQRSKAEGEVVLRASVENALDRRAWKESPFQYEHVYLYPLDPRTAQISLQVGL